MHGRTFYHSQSFPKNGTPMHRSSSLFAFLVILLAAGAVEPSAAIAQIVDYPQTRDADGVQATIQQLFDGMRAGDSTMVRAVIHPQARFQTTLTRDGRPLPHAAS